MMALLRSLDRDLLDRADYYLYERIDEGFELALLPSVCFEFDVTCLGK